MTTGTKAPRARTRKAGAEGEPLAEYAAKRSFEATPEPAPARRANARGPLLFVVQQHSARRLHFDFRLELDGVLRSWAVPRGLVIAPGEKHLAVPTEDHPFDYASFEGVIPPKQYGAGPVIVWDCGLYSPDEGTDGRRGAYAFDDREEAERRVRHGLERGKLSFFLLGGKLKGSFSLVKTSKGKDWLLVKHRDDFTGAVLAAGGRNESLLSGLTVEEMKAAPAPPRIAAEALVPFGPPEAVPKAALPMLAVPVDTLPRGAEWRFEPKLDGYRVLAYVGPDGVKLKSRRGLDMTRPFPDVTADLERLAAVFGNARLVLDGELIALGEDGRPSFNALQNRAQLKSDAEIRRAAAANPCVFACFDVLHFAGMNLRDAPYSDRIRYLAQLLLPFPHLQRIESNADGDALYDAALAAGFEGVVAKQVHGRYEAGRRSPSWQKRKAVQSDEFCIGGYAEGRGSRAERFGSLLVGKPVGKGRRAKLRYMGRVGTGFDEGLLRDLRSRFDRLATDEPPFAGMPPIGRPTTWLKPELVAEIRYAEITPDGYLRAPVFVRLRDDTKPAPFAASQTNAGSRNAAARTREAGPAPDPEAALILAALDGRDDRALVRVAGDSIGFTNLNKVLWPADEAAGLRAYTKRDFIRYLVQVSPWLLPHVKDRPVTMIRMPDGIGGERFFQKHWDRKSPRFVETVTVYSESRDEPHTYFLCQNLATLVWLGQIGSLELHVWHSRASLWPEAAGGDVDAGTDYAGSLESLEASILNRPDWVVFDIDPYIYSGREPKGGEPEYNDHAFDKAKEVAFRLRDLLAQLGLSALVKTSGKTGLHVFVPIVRNLDFGAVRSVSEAVSRHLERRYPADITTEWSVRKRTGRIFLDYNMNARAKTLNVAYSPRGVPGAPVSMPLGWDELEKARPMDFTMENVPGRLQRTGDRWSDALRAKQNLDALVKFWKG